MSLQKDIWKQVAVKYDENETERWMGKKDGNRRDQMTTFSFLTFELSRTFHMRYMLVLLVLMQPLSSSVTLIWFFSTGKILTCLQDTHTHKHTYTTKEWRREHWSGLLKVNMCQEYINSFTTVDNFRWSYSSCGVLWKSQMKMVRGAAGMAQEKVRKNVKRRPNDCFFPHSYRKYKFICHLEGIRFWKLVHHNVVTKHCR